MNFWPFNRKKKQMTEFRAEVAGRVLRENARKREIAYARLDEALEGLSDSNQETVDD